MTLKTLNEIIEEFGYKVLPLGQTISLIECDGGEIERVKIIHNPFSENEKDRYAFYVHNTDLFYTVDYVGEMYILIKDFIKNIRRIERDKFYTLPSEAFGVSKGQQVSQEVYTAMLEKHCPYTTKYAHVNETENK